MNKSVEKRQELADKLFEWMNTKEVVAEFWTGYELIRVYKVDGEEVNNLPEYHVIRAFHVGTKPVVSGDAINVDADEAFAALQRVMIF